MNAQSKKFLRFVLAGWLAVATLAASEHHGVVKFGGLPVPGATVTATQGDKRLVAVTDQQGLYEFPDLADGVWNIEVDMLCFAPIKQEVAVAPNAPAAQWDLKLLPFDQIKASAPPPPPPVPAAAPAAPTQTASAAEAPKAAAPSKKSKSKGKKNAQGPAAANPEGGFQHASLNASANGSNPPAEQQGGGTEELNAAPADGFLINGSVNNGANSPFAQSNAFGNNRRLGRSLYNGNIGITFDNSNLDARPFSLTGQDTARPAYNRETGLFSFGGPIPLIHAQYRPMFTVNYQWTRNRNADIGDALVPTAAQRAGDLGAAGIIPPSLISPQAQALLSLYPLPNFTSPLYNYQVPLVGISHQDAMQVRMNKLVGRMNQVNGMFAFQSIRNANPTIFNFQDTTRQLGMTTQVSWLHRFNQRLFLTLTPAYSRMSIRTAPFFANRQNISGDAGIVGNNQEPVNWGPPGLTFASGIAGLNDANASFARAQTAGFSTNVFWSRSPHNVQYGFDVKRQQINLLGQQNPRGSFAFTGMGGADFASFLMGVPDTVSIAFGNADKYFRSWMLDGYILDDWRVGPGFTLNYGLRWDYGSPITELYNRLVNLDIAPGFAAVAPVVGTDPTGALTGTHYRDSLVNPDYTGFEPRIGFAWHPILASSLVIRGGYSVSYDTSVYRSIATSMAQQSPLSKSLSMQGTGLTMATAFNAPPSNTPNTYGIDPNFRPGYAQNWQLSVQRDLAGSLVVTATYLGIKGTHARQYLLPNTWPLGAANPCPDCPTGFEYEISGGNSSRQAATFQLRRRLRAGFTASATYTFSKSIDDGVVGGLSTAGVSATRGAEVAQNWLDLRAERALSTFDQRHLLNVQAQYSTGQGIGGGALMGGWKGALLKEWTFVTNLTVGSGFPLTPTYFEAVAGTGVTGTIRPDYTGAPLYAAPPGLFLNPAAFVAPTPGQWGNAGRDSITGPSQFSLNASLGRTFSISDRKNLDLRFDATNVLNHVAYTSWNTTINSPQFGFPVAANAMRSIQTTLRLRF